jgi:hypothetical protein
VFGLALRGADGEGSDLDIRVDPTPETALLDMGAIRRELRRPLGVPVDVLTPMVLPRHDRNCRLPHPTTLSAAFPSRRGRITIATSCPSAARKRSRRRAENWRKPQSGIFDTSGGRTPNRKAV